MTINIDSREAETLLAEIQAATHQESAHIVLKLLRSEAGRLRRAREIEQRRKRITNLARRYAARAAKQQMASPEEIIGYDDSGLPA